MVCFSLQIEILNLKHKSAYIQGPRLFEAPEHFPSLHAILEHR